MTSTGTTPKHRGRGLAAMTALALGLAALGVVTATPASAAPPGNDNLASATAISPGNWGPTVTDATLEPGETGQPGCDLIAHSIWMVYTATDNQVAHLFTTGGHDMVVNVWTSSTPATPTIDSLQPVTCDDETLTPDADVYWQLTTGTKYFVQIANYDGFDDENDGGAFTFAKAAGPGNNNLSAATAVSLDASATTGTTDFSSLEPGEPSDADCAEPYDSIWYSWTAPASTGVDAQTSSVDPDRDTVLRVYSGTAAFNDLDPVGCNDDIDDVNPLSRVGFNAVQGVTYFFQVSDPAFNAAHAVPGALAFRLTTHPAPANDLLAGATVASVPSTVGADTTYAGTEAGEPQPTGTGCHDLAHSLWYRYQASSSGTLGVETLASTDIDTNLAIYSGPASGATLPGLTQVGCNDDKHSGDLLSKATVPVTAGTTYYVQVGNYTGFGPQAGAFQVHFFSGTTTSLDASAAGRTVTLATTVAGLAGPAHGGSVQFFDGAKVKGTVPLEDDGSAVLTLAGAASGAHSYKAVFVPEDGDFTTSESAAKPVTVTDAPPSSGAAASSTKLTVPKKVLQGKKAMIEVSVSTAAGPATGSVLVVLGGKLVTLTLTNGKATLSTKLKTPGSVSVVAVYAGTDTARSSTATAKIKVKKKPRKK